MSPPPPTFVIESDDGPASDVINVDQDFEPTSAAASAGGLQVLGPSASQLTHQRSLRHYLTREALPHLDHYRNTFQKGTHDLNNIV